jgi:hypothetical protein
VQRCSISSLHLHLLPAFLISILLNFPPEGQEANIISVSKTQITKVFTMAEPFSSSWIPIQLLFFLRSIQLGSIVLTGFIAIYFVYWHDILHNQIPLGLIIIISTVTHTIPTLIEHPTNSRNRAVSLSSKTIYHPPTLSPSFPQILV